MCLGYRLQEIDRGGLAKSVRRKLARAIGLKIFVPFEAGGNAEPPLFGAIMLAPPRGKPQRAVAPAGVAQPGRLSLGRGNGVQKLWPEPSLAIFPTAASGRPCTRIPAPSSRRQ